MPKTDSTRAKADKPKKHKAPKAGKAPKKHKAGKAASETPPKAGKPGTSEKRQKAARTDDTQPASTAPGDSGKMGAAIAASSGELPSTLARSPVKARETWQQTHDSAVQSYGEGERAHRTAFASLKHSFEKVGDHWEPKAEKGPSDARAAKGGTAADRGGETAGGVDANATKAHLLEVAARLEIPGRSRMAKPDLVEAIDKANRRETAKARQRSQ